MPRHAKQTRRNCFAMSRNTHRHGGAIALLKSTYGSLTQSWTRRHISAPDRVSACLTYVALLAQPHCGAFSFASSAGVLRRMLKACIPKSYSALSSAFTARCRAICGLPVNASDTISTKKSASVISETHESPRYRHPVRPWLHGGHASTN